MSRLWRPDYRQRPSFVFQWCPRESGSFVGARLPVCQEKWLYQSRRTSHRSHSSTGFLRSVDLKGKAIAIACVISSIPQPTCNQGTVWLLFFMVGWLIWQQRSLYCWPCVTFSRSLERSTAVATARSKFSQISIFPWAKISWARW